MSRTELENAKEYQIDQARLQETAAWLQRTLDQLDETSNSSGQSTTRGHGCLGVDSVCAWRLCSQASLRLDSGRSMTRHGHTEGKPDGFDTVK